jgi:hypothetical protein
MTDTAPQRKDPDRPFLDSSQDKGRRGSLSHVEKTAVTPLGLNVFFCFHS